MRANSDFMHPSIDEFSYKIENITKIDTVMKVYNKYKQDKEITFNFPEAFPENMTFSKGAKIADDFNSAPHSTRNKRVIESYKALKNEIVEQLEYLLYYLNFSLEPYFSQEKKEPYQNSQEMFLDILQNRHLYFLPTNTAFGEDDYYSDNFLLEESPLKLGGNSLLYNDVFRIVHDIFAHNMYQLSFGPIGEDKAWLVHMRITSPLARPALSFETRGQNCWVNFGPHLRDLDGKLYPKTHPKWVSPDKRPFAPQKNNILSSRFTGIELYIDSKGAVRANELDNWTPNDF